MYGPPRAWALVLLSPAPVLAYGVPVIVAAIVATVIGLSIVPRDSLVIVNANLTELVSTPEELLAAAIASILLCAGHAFGITAATHSLIANTTDSSLPAFAAWNRAARRPGLVALAFAGALAVAVAAVAASVALVIAPLWAIGGLVVALIVLIVVAPLLLAWPQLVLRSTSWGQALARGWRSGKVVVSGRAEERTPRVNLIIATVVVGGLGVGLRLLAGLMPQSLLSAMVAVALGIVVPAALVLVLTAVAVRAVIVREESRARVGTQPIVPLSAFSWAEKKSDAGTRAGALVGLVVLLVPALLAAPLALVNPWGFASYSAATVPVVWDSADITAVGDRSGVLSVLGGEETTVTFCGASECSVELEPGSILGSGIAGTPDNHLLFAQWMPQKGQGSTPDRFELQVLASDADELEAWGTKSSPDAPPKGDAVPGTRTVLSGYDAYFSGGDSVYARSNRRLTAAAISTDGDHPVIAAIARPGLNSINTDVLIYFCNDDACTTSTERRVPVSWRGGESTVATLDVAVMADGTAVVTLVDARDSRDPDVVPLRVISASVSSEPRIETPETSATDPDDTSYDTTFGARIERGADGMPVILSRAESQTDMRMFTCLTVDCAEYDATDIPSGLNIPSDQSSLSRDTLISQMRTPTFAIDATGRPLIARVDVQSRSLDLLSCVDKLCTNSTSTRLATLEFDDDLYLASGLALGLAADQRPVIAVGGRRVGADTDHPRWTGTVLECSDARCGLD
ncbi:hypothetical protein SAMN06295943_1973 [Agreia sp. VKM Ac-1783]|nr:hypothetical protein SAMN06295943_1973 [Agreia sp. VKM Ac-1783]